MKPLKRRSFIKQAFLTALAARTTLEALGNDSYASFPSLQIIDPEKYWQTVRNMFSLTDQRTYLNTAGLGPAPKVVIDIYTSALKDSAVSGENPHRHFDDVRKDAAEFFNCDEDEFSFTRNATESINLIARGLKLAKGDRVIMSTHEHVGGAAPWLMLQQENGIEIDLFTPDHEDPSNIAGQIEALITKKTKVIFVSHVLCTTGLIMPIKAISEICKSKKILLVVDGAQAGGMIPVNFKDLGVDYYAGSGHKWMHGPVETGFLMIKKERQASHKPVFAGAYSNSDYCLDKLSFSFKTTADRNETGTRDSAKILAFGEALTFLTTLDMIEIEKRLRFLSGFLRNQLETIAQVEILSPAGEYQSGILTFKLKNKNYTEVQKILLEEYKIRVRGIYEGNLDAIRISCAVFNSPAELEQLAFAIKKIAAA